MDKLSVIMPSLNAGNFIDEAIHSCLKQRELFQLIIVDGGSHKDTKLRILNWANKDKRIKFFFENDNGPADALNKALSIAEGKYIGWLNSDDKYEDYSFERAFKVFENNQNLKFIYGHGQHINEFGEFIEYYPSLSPENGINKFQDGCFICQPTIFIKKESPIILSYV